MPNIHHHRANLQQGLKQQTLSITNTQQDLTGGINKFRHQGYASFQQQVFIQLYQGIGCSQHLRNYSFLRCESLYIYILGTNWNSLNTKPGYDPGTCGLWVHLSYARLRNYHSITYNL